MSASDVRHRIAENVAVVRERIAKAAAQSGRSADAVTLVAVTKYVPVDVASALVEAGCLNLGESRPQELWSKAEALGACGMSTPTPSPLMGEGRGEGEGAKIRNRSAPPSPGPGAPGPPSPTSGEGRIIRWHLIGHLQRNKIRRTLPLLQLLHSVDSQRLLAALNDEAAQLGLQVAALVELNISDDAAKTGLPPVNLEPLLQTAVTLSHVSIRGLMGMASLEGGQAAAQRDFARLRQLRDQAAQNLPSNVSLTELSMGMSEDFEVAIAEGATIVRVGSALVEGIIEVK